MKMRKQIIFTVAFAVVMATVSAAYGLYFVKEPLKYALFNFLPITAVSYAWSAKP